jgi:hypothetical protein
LITTVLIYLFSCALAKSIMKLVTRLRKPNNFDDGLYQYVKSSSDHTTISFEIKTFLLDLINYSKNYHEKFDVARVYLAKIYTR